MLRTILKCKYKTLRKEKETESSSIGLYSRGWAVRYRKAAEAAAHCRRQQHIVESRNSSSRAGAPLSRAAACCRGQRRVVEGSGGLSRAGAHG